MGIAATIVAGLLVLALAWFKLASVDIGYHVAYGGWFLDHGHIVDRDPFLLPAVTKSFVNANWGSQIVMALAYRAADAGGLFALRVLLIAGIFALMGRIVYRTTRRWQTVAWTWALAGLAAYERFTMRPELFSYAFMLAMLALLNGRSLTRRRIILLAILQLAWVNFHSYFLVGLMLTGAYAGTAWIRVLLAGPSRPDAGGESARARLLMWALAIQIAVCFINPWGYRGATFPVQALRSLEAGGILGSTPDRAATDNPWSLISEFHSPWSHFEMRVASRTLSGYVLVVALSGLAAIMAIRRGRWAELLFLVALFAMSCQMRRNIAQFALAGVPIAMCLLVAPVSLDQPIRRFRALIGNIATVGLAVLAVVWIVGIVDGRFYYSERRLNREFGFGYSSRSFANDAAAWLGRQADVEPGLFVNYNASSNALPKLGGRFKLLVDTNTFAYNEDTLGLAQRLGQGSDRYAETLEKLGLQAALIQCGADADALVRQLAADYTEWALVYFDRQAVIFVRRIPAHVPLISANRVDAARLDPAAWMTAAPSSGIARAVDLTASAAVPLALEWHDRAMPMLQDAVAAAPDYDEAWVNLGKCFGIRANRARAEGRTADEAAVDLREAIRCFERAKAIHPLSVEAASNLQKANQSLESLFPQARPGGRI